MICEYIITISDHRAKDGVVVADVFFRRMKNMCKGFQSELQLVM